MEFPAGVLKSDLDGDAVGGGGFDHAAAAGELVAAGEAGVPADDAVGGRGVADGSGRVEFERRLGGRRGRGGEVHVGDVALFAVGGADVGGVAFVVGEDGDLLAAGEGGDLAHGQGLLGVGGHRNVCDAGAVDVGAWRGGYAGIGGRFLCEQRRARKQQCGAEQNVFGGQRHGRTSLRKRIKNLSCLR